MFGTGDLSKAVAKRYSLRNKEGKALVEFVFAEIGRQLAAGEKVSIRGFGNFEAVQTKERTIKNPRTGEPTQVPPGCRVLLSASKNLKAEVNLGMGNIDEAKYEEITGKKPGEAVVEAKEGDKEPEDSKAPAGDEKAKK